MRRERKGWGKPTGAPLEWERGADAGTQNAPAYCSYSSCSFLLDQRSDVAMESEVKWWGWGVRGSSPGAHARAGERRWCE